MNPSQQLFALAVKIHTPHQQIVMAACAYARTALQYIPSGEDRPRIAIETTEKWCRGEATLEEVEQARDKANQYWAAADVAHAAVVAAASAAGAALGAHAAASARAAAGAVDAVYVARKEYDQAHQQADQEMCQLILEHIPRLKNLMVLS